MGAKTGIEWTDATWNPIRGCARVSEGCRNCYAESVAYRFSGAGQPYEGLAVLKNGHASWTGKIQFVEKHLLDPLKWKTPRRIFVNSMSDLFHEGVTDEMRDKIFAVMALCPQHTFQVLTKRPERMLKYIGPGESTERIIAISDALVDSIGADDPIADRLICRGMDAITKPNPNDKWDDLVYPWPLPNVWLGVSIENQKAADDRLDYLCELASQGWRTMVSFEPLLGSVNPGPWWLSLGAKTWAIVGGESGPGARPMHPDWARSLRDQCAAAGVPFFFKQWGEWAPGECVDATSGIVQTATWFDSRWSFDRANLADDEGHRDDEPDLYRLGKHAAGALLDGVEHKAFPEVR